MTNQTIKFKDSQYVVTWLDAALDKEKEKYDKCPVGRDMMPGFEAAQVWGYVVAGYFLVEESFKALLYLRGKQVPTKHSLTMLFDLFDADDKELLREYYSDYRATIGDDNNRFPLNTLDEFLKNLDGDQNKKGTDHIGSFDWRYFLIEERRSKKMPFISVEFLHEITYGTIRMVEYAHNGNFEPSQYTHSWRMRRERKEKFDDWLMVQANSDRWKELDGSLVILWGPDYRKRCDMLQFQGNANPLGYFTEIPKNYSLPIVDKRKELENFDVDEELNKIGVTRYFPRPIRDANK